MLQEVHHLSEILLLSDRQMESLLSEEIFSSQNGALTWSRAVAQPHKLFISKELRLVPEGHRGCRGLLNDKGKRINGYQISH
jgi:hypothetical protein